MKRSLPKTETRPSGFTLIELLVSISIVAILSAIGIIVYTSVMKQGYDSRRQSDLRTIQSALEQYYTDHLYYPELRAGNCPNNTTPDNKFRFGCALTDSTGNKTYLGTIPQDPISSNQKYCYAPYPDSCDNAATNCTTYSLYAKLENTPNGSGSCGSYTFYNLTVTPP